MTFMYINPEQGGGSRGACPSNIDMKIIFYFYLRCVSFRNLRSTRSTKDTFPCEEFLVFCITFAADAWSQTDVLATRKTPSSAIAVRNDSNAKMS